MTLHLLPDQPRLRISRKHGRKTRWPQSWALISRPLLYFRYDCFNSASALQLCKESVANLGRPVGRDSPAPIQLELLRYLNEGFDESKWRRFFLVSSFFKSFSFIVYTPMGMSYLSFARTVLAQVLVNDVVSWPLGLFLLIYPLGSSEQGSTGIPPNAKPLTSTAIDFSREILLFAAVNTTQSSTLGGLRHERHIFSAAVFGRYVAKRRM
ncbi:hypothetical protein LENED_005476 [Lentinula edodes]|uniref:Uncharacterized protein n=1 Tax=Lentinula edodes TaxID=5353 RepID=A0A1Q3E937_LENED|nr:hypothetical protein LENED_005476 [Lentinula edodes]